MKTYFVAAFSSEAKEVILEQVNASPGRKKVQRWRTEIRMASDGKRYRVMRISRTCLVQLKNILKKEKRHLTYLTFAGIQNGGELEILPELFPPIGESKRLRHALKQVRGRPALQ